MLQVDSHKPRGLARNLRLEIVLLTASVTETFCDHPKLLSFVTSASPLFIGLWGNKPESSESSSTTRQPSTCSATILANSRMLSSGKPQTLNTSNLSLANVMPIASARSDVYKKLRRALPSE